MVLYSMLYGSVPFKANNMEELHTMILSAKFTLKEDISIEARELLKGMLERNPKKRIKVPEILKHAWFKDINKEITIFSEQEKAQIRKEFTYNEARRIQREDDELEAADCFTELEIDTDLNQDLKNVSSKSIILAPFTSTKSHVSSLHSSVKALMEDKNKVLRFAAKCRENDRRYEMENCWELDNGVYNKFIYNSPDEDSKGEENDFSESSGTNRSNLNKKKKKKSTKPKGADAFLNDSLDSSFKESTLKSMEEDQKRKQSHQFFTEEDEDEGEDHMRRMKELLQVDKYDEKELNRMDTDTSHYNFILDEKIVDATCQFGYPREYVIKSLKNNEANYCTAAYYLLGTDQDYSK